MGPGRDSAGILALLVGFDTTSARSNLALVDDVQHALAAQGVAITLVRDPSQPKAALHAVVGPAVAGGVALSAHSDCVPVEGQEWQADPFAMRREAGRLAA